MLFCILVENLFLGSQIERKVKLAFEICFLEILKSLWKAKQMQFRYGERVGRISKLGFGYKLHSYIMSCEKAYWYKLNYISRGGCKIQFKSTTESFFTIEYTVL